MGRCVCNTSCTGLLYQHALDFQYMFSTMRQELTFTPVIYSCNTILSKVSQSNSLVTTGIALEKTGKMSSWIGHAFKMYVQVDIEQ